MWWFKDTDDMGLAQQGQPNPLPLPRAQAKTYPLSGSGPILGFANRFVRGHGSICGLACCLEASTLRCRISLPVETDCKHEIKFGQCWHGVTCTNLAGMCCITQIPQFQSPLGRLSVFPGHGDVKTLPPEHKDFDRDVLVFCSALCLNIPFSITQTREGPTTPVRNGSNPQVPFKGSKFASRP